MSILPWRMTHRAHLRANSLSSTLSSRYVNFQPMLDIENQPVVLPLPLPAALLYNQNCNPRP